MSLLAHGGTPGLIVELLPLILLLIGAFFIIRRQSGEDTDPDGDETIEPESRSDS